MINTYLKICWRNLIKNKGYSAINIFGLSIGLAVAILIFGWIGDELSFNNYHKHHQTIAQVMAIRRFNGEPTRDGTLPNMLGTTLRNKYGGDFEAVCMTSWNWRHTLRTDGKMINTTGMWVEPVFASMFSLTMLNGDQNGLKDPSAVLLSHSLAVTLFGSDDPVNKTVRQDNNKDFKVAGVYEDLPANTTLYETKLLLPWNMAKNDWEEVSQMYVQIKDHGNMTAISDKIKNASMADPAEAAAEKQELVLFPMDFWRLHNEFKNGKISGGRIQYVWLFGIIGILVLLLACINFMNLSTARSGKRAREVGVRKTVGSLRGQLIAQFLTESIVVAFIALIFALALVYFSLPFFNRFADKTIHLRTADIYFWLFILGFTLFTGIVSGCYPAFYLSGFQPVKVLKGTFRAGRFAALPRKVMVVFQFSISTALIIGTLIVYRQIQYGQNRPVGYGREGLITIDMMNAPDLRSHYNALHNDLIATGKVENVTLSSTPTTESFSDEIGFSWPGKNPNTLPRFNALGVSTDFGSTINWKIREGRDFSGNFQTDSTAMIMNEAAVKLMGLKDVLGLTITWDNHPSFHVVGVINDMVMESPYEPVKPTFIFMHPEWANLMIIRLKAAGPMQAAIAKVETVFKKYNSSAPFEYKFTDKEYAKKFEDEQRIGNLSGFFAFLAIFISCLGLFGLASFVAEQRTKEIGMRKVLGASVFNIWKMLSKDFVNLVILSCVIAIPVAWYFLSQWLQKYTYRTDISWWIFMAAALGTIVITLLTVSYQAIKAALMSPTKSLRAQ